jgi:hypothetical protein
MAGDNPRRDAGPNAGIKNEPTDRVPCDDPMTGLEAFHLRTHSEQADERDACAPNLTKAEAGNRIDPLNGRSGSATAEPVAGRNLAPSPRRGEARRSVARLATTRFRTQSAAASTASSRLAQGGQPRGGAAGAAGKW